MAFDIFKNRGRGGPPEDDAAKTRTPEEKALLAKAKEEAAKREDERRDNALDVGDFLGDMLDASAPRAEEELDQERLSSGPGVEPGASPEPNVDLELRGDEAMPPEERESAEAYSPFAVLADEAEEPPPIRRPSAVRLDPVEATPREGPGGRELSPLMRKVMRDLQALGGAGDDKSLAYEPETAAADTSQTMEILIQGRRRPAMALDFEPEDAAEEPNLEKTRAPTTVMESLPEADPEEQAGHTSEEAGASGGEGAPEAGGAEGGGDDWLASREYSLEDLPEGGLSNNLTGEDEEPGEHADDDALQEGDLGGADLLDAAGENDDALSPLPGSGDVGASELKADADPEYGLDDLPSALAGSGGMEEEDSAPVEPAMEESTFDDRGLDVALAAADDAVPEEESPEDSASSAETVASPSEAETVAAQEANEPGGGAEVEETTPAYAKETKEVKEVAAPAVETGSGYGLDDLPAVPQDTDMMLPSDERSASASASAGAGDQLADQSLPDLVPPTIAAEGAAAPDSAGFTGVERALDGQVEPSMDGPAAPVPTPAPALIPDMSGAEHAADLNVSQLAEVEKLIEKEVELEELRTIAEQEEVAPPEPRLAFLVRWVCSISAIVAATFTRVRDAADTKLAPYSLSCKIILGISGILLLAVVGALGFKTWILPAWSPPAG